MLVTATTVAACSPSSEETTSAAPSDEIEQAGAFEVDQVVTVEAGTGQGEQARRIITTFSPNATNADHVGTVDTPQGEVHIITYREHDPILPGGVGHCVAAVGGETGAASCGFDPINAAGAGVSMMSAPGGFHSVTSFGGEAAVFAIVTTDKSASIGVNTARGWAYAQWPSGWGAPASITFYDTDGNEVFTEDYSF